MVLSTTADFPELVPQPDSEQGDFKVSVYLKETHGAKVLPQIKFQLNTTGLDIKLIYSSGIDLDIVPISSDKCQAMEFLR